MRRDTTIREWLTWGGHPEGILRDAAMLAFDVINLNGGYSPRGDGAFFSPRYELRRLRKGKSFVVASRFLNPDGSSVAGSLAVTDHTLRITHFSIKGCKDANLLEVGLLATIEEPLLFVRGLPDGTNGGVVVTIDRSVGVILASKQDLSVIAVAARWPSPRELSIARSADNVSALAADNGADWTY
jgi:hypothetical protein